MVCGQAGRLSPLKKTSLPGKSLLWDAAMWNKPSVVNTNVDTWEPIIRFRCIFRCIIVDGHHPPLHTQAFRLPFQLFVQRILRRFHYYLSYGEAMPRKLSEYTADVISRITMTNPVSTMQTALLGPSFHGWRLLKGGGVPPKCGCNKFSVASRPVFVRLSAKISSCRWYNNFVYNFLTNARSRISVGHHNDEFFGCDSKRSRLRR